MTYLTLESSYLKRFWSSLQSYPFWIILYNQIIKYFPQNTLFHWIYSVIGLIFAEPQFKIQLDWKTFEKILNIKEVKKSQKHTSYTHGLVFFQGSFIVRLCESQQSHSIKYNSIKKTLKKTWKLKSHKVKNSEKHTSETHGLDFFFKVVSVAV